MDIISSLFKSKIRQKMLTLFFSNESARFYINEMARLVGTSQGTCRRELNKLAELGIISTSREANLQYYSLNKQFSLYQEFSSVVQKTIGIAAKIRSVLQGMKGISYAFIFGSYAKKQFGPKSDIDVMVIGAVDEGKISRFFKEITMATGREINYHIYTEKEFIKNLQANSFVRNVIKDAILVFGNEQEFRKLLKAA